LRIKHRPQDLFLLLRRQRIDDHQPRFHEGSAETGDPLVRHPVINLEFQRSWPRRACLKARRRFGGQAISRL
jgi:hypothetical protein